MINEIPAIRSESEMTFTRLGAEEEIDMTLNRKRGQMTFSKVVWNDDKDDWESNEVYLEEIENELTDYGFLTIGPEPMSIGQLKTHFSFKMFFKR